eukprot:TRINITY_DN2059_c0_g1_i8.p1 TRINITY_DN2059_c0_g1~~TRINITY_DN2059_c0_g1_i8.p1  ORF type:complete len:801 (+),score=209.40 TRINITY_DN2059_c0_g1_i8:427-2829(+)
MTKSSKRKLLEEAGSHKENHRYDEAIECYERILEMDGMHYGALIGKGESLKELGQFQEAILVFDQAIALNEDKVSGWNGKGSSLMELGEFESAVECFQRSIRQNPEDWNTYDLLGVAFDKSHDHPSALEAFDTALELNKDNSIVYFHQGNTLSAATYHDEALHSFQQCLKIDPSYVPAYLKQAATLQTLERHEEAVTCCNTAIALNPSHELLYYTKATSLYHLQRPTDALASVNKALSLNSGNAPRAASAHLLRAKILTQLHLVSHAILACQQAINLVQNDHERNQAQSLLDELQSADQSESVATDNNNDDDNAIDVNIIEGADDPADLAPSSSSSSSSSTSSNNPDQPFSLELMLGKRKSTKKSSTRKLYKQANDLLAEGHFDQAIEHFDQILEMDGMHYGALIGKGESYKELGHYQQAINVFEQAISVNEDKVSGWNGKGAALLELGDFQSAVECLHRSIRQNPEDWSTYDLLGVALDKMKDHSAALDAFESSLELNQDNSLVWFHKAECLFSLMNYEESLHSYCTIHNCCNIKRNQLTRFPSLVCFQGKSLRGRFAVSSFVCFLTHMLQILQYTKPYSNGFCDDTSNSASELSGELLCPTCKCMDSTLRTKQWPSTTNKLASCYNTTCVQQSDNSKVLMIKSQLSWVECPTAGGELTVPGYSGAISCPAATEYCTSQVMADVGAWPTISTVSPDKGPKAGGTKITIKGLNIAQGTTVAVGGKSCDGPVVATDGTSVECTTTAFDAETKYWISLDTPAGRGTSLDNAFTVPAESAAVSLSVSQLLLVGLTMIVAVILI